MIFPCPHENCDKKYFSQKGLDDHDRRCHSGIVFICDICKKNLSSKQKLTYHIQNIHQSPKKKRNATCQKVRSDAGKPNLSELSKLSGFKLLPSIEKELMARNETVFAKIDELVKFKIQRSQK